LFGMREVIDMYVQLIRDTLFAPEGSVVKVTGEIRGMYTGVWSSAFGTVRLSFRKEHCVQLDERKTDGLSTG